MATSSLRNDLKRLAGQSVIYGVGSMGVKAIGFLLIPLYTRFLTPADYGVLAITGSIGAILSILYTLSLRAAAMRFYFDAESEEERQRINGTIWIAMLVASLAMALFLEVGGPTLFPLLFHEVPFSPYIRIVVWSTFLAGAGELLMTLYRAQERPRAFVAVTMGRTLLTMLCVVGFVVVARMGALGYLLGVLVASALLALPYLWLTLRQVRLTFQWPILHAALLFSLPIIPHSIAAWVLELSDRIVLERFVSLSDLGLYNLAYQYGSVIYFVATAINFVWNPYLYKSFREEGERAQARLERVVTYYVLLLVSGATALALLGREAILLFAAPPYHAAYQIVPWIVGGQLLSGLYYVPVSFLFLRKKTRLVPLVTLLAGGANVLMNLWLIPRVGILGAALATFGGYALMLLIVWALARHVFAFHYEYRRIAILLLTGLCLFTAGRLVGTPSLWTAVLLKGGLLLNFPLLLYLFGFFSREERAAVAQLVRRLRLRQRN